MERNQKKEKSYTVKLGYNELGYSEQIFKLVILIHKLTRLKRIPVITNKNGRSQDVRYNRVSL
jgi:hypothetical protein